MRKAKNHFVKQTTLTRWWIILVLIWINLTTNMFAQQVPDTSFSFSIRQPAFERGKGHLILIDQAHFNFHTRSGGFSPFSKLMEQDGYRVQSLEKTLVDRKSLSDCKILVIANALNRSNSENWVLPNPSAFTIGEIDLIRQWVMNGGRLLLIADHMPFAGAAFELGKAFGYEFINGFAFTSEGSWPPSVFSLRDETLRASPPTTGIMESEKIARIATFTGSAFRAPAGSIPVLAFLQENYSLQPDTAWVFNSNTPRQQLKGCYQGSIGNFGKGRVAVFGEAAMFTAQLVNGTRKVGFNSEEAPQNAQFTLNLIHWLDGLNEKSPVSR